MVRVVNAQNQAHDEMHKNIDWLEVSASSEDLRATILELQDVKQRQDVVNQIIDRLDRNQSDDEAAFNRERDRLQNVRDALRARKSLVEEKLAELTNPRRYAMSQDYRTMDSHHMTNNNQAMEGSQDAERITGFYSSEAPSEEIDRDKALERAWEKKDFEKVVELASLNIEEHAAAPTRSHHEGIRQLCANLRCRFRAYKAMKLLSLAVADADRVLQLVTTHGDDLDTDLKSLFVIKSKDAVASRTQEGSLKRPSADELTPNTVKRPRRKAEQQVHMPSVFRLSTELICSIADFIETADRVRLANSCRQFRRIPQLWHQLVFTRTRKVPKEGWHRDTIDACITAIQTCQRRSYGALCGVVLRGYINSGSLSSIFDALRPSFSTLKFLAIPAIDQKLCYNHLYQHCPSLSGIDIRLYYRDSAEPFSYPVMPEMHLADKYSFFPPSQMPFKLSCFIADPSYDCGNISANMQNLELVQGITPKRQVQASFIQGIRSAAPTLREWIDCRKSKWMINSVRADLTKDQLPAAPIVFPRLRKLAALWSQILRGCEFPALEELSFNAHQEIVGESLMEDHSTQAVNIITRSPSLKKLHIFLPSQASSQREIFNGIAQMEHLEELHVCVRKHGFSIQPLIDCQRAGNDAAAHLMWPSLHTLGLYNRDWPLSSDPALQLELVDLLVMRFFLQKGCRHDEAKKRTEAALAAYDINKANKRQKKKLATEAVAAASASVYPGTFEVHDGIRRETFSPVLPKLVVQTDRQSGYPTESEKLLGQLIATTIEDISVTDPFWSCHTNIV